MKLQANYKKHVLQFRFEAGTSRGIMQNREIWLLILTETKRHSAVLGIGEAAPISGLSIEDISRMDEKLSEVCNAINEKGFYSVEEVASVVNLRKFPSVFFALEIAFKDLRQGGKRTIFKNSFVGSNMKIPINGLVWMGSFDHMWQQVVQKIKEGYGCIKIKIGALDFESECDLLKKIRGDYSKNEIVIKLDANGAFQPKEALTKLERMEEFDIHSIEQPIKAGQTELMKELCAKSPVAITLDEELIGITSGAGKANLLEEIRPAYLVLKPSLLGGFKATEEWIGLAEEMKIGWWLTSALESNIGLNAISQFAASYPLTNLQGLGTGQLYHNNIPSPLVVNGGFIFYDAELPWDLSGII